MVLTAVGVTEFSGESDWFKAILVSGQSYMLKLGASITRGTFMETSLVSYPGQSDPAQKIYGSSLHFTATSSGPYFFEVIYGNSLVASQGRSPYSLTLTPVIDDFADNFSSTGTFIDNPAGGVRTRGVIEQSRDVDVFSVTLNAGQTYQLSSSNSLVQAYVLEPDAAGSFYFITPQKTGTYHIAATASSAAGNYVLALNPVNFTDDYASSPSTTGTLTLNTQSGGQASGSTTGIHEIAFERDWFKVTLDADTLYKISASYDTVAGSDNMNIRLFDSNGESLLPSPSNPFSGGIFKVGATGTYYIETQAYGSIANTSILNNHYSVSVASIADDHLDNVRTTGAIAVGATASGVFNGNDDEDWFAVNLVAGQSYKISGSAAMALGEKIQLRFVDTLSSNTDEGLQTITATRSGTYYVSAKGIYNPNNGESRAYQLDLTNYSDDYSDNSMTKGRVVVGGSASGVGEVASDTDWFQADLIGGTSYVISSPTVYFNGSHVKDVFIANGDRLDIHTSINVTFTAPSTGIYYIAMESSVANDNYTFNFNSYNDDYTDNPSRTGAFFDGATLFPTGGSDLLLSYGGTTNIYTNIDGLGGIDTLIYSLSRGSATVISNGNGTLAVNAGTQGTYALANIERLQFSDGVYSFQFADPSGVLLKNFSVNAGGWSSQNLYPRHVADVNGDGINDIVGFGHAGVLVSYGTIYDPAFNDPVTFGAPQLILSNFGQADGWSTDNQFHRELADVNGDGRADIIGFGFAGALVSLARANGSFANPATGIADFGANQGWTTQDGFARTVGDVNGDGKADIIGFGYGGTLVSLGNGDGTFQAARLGIGDFGVMQGWTSDNLLHRAVADVNGDGKDDIIGFGTVGTYVALSNGDGTFSTAQLKLDNFSKTQGWSSQDGFSRQVGDVNGDGYADIVGFGTAGTYVAYGKGDGGFWDASVDLSNFGVAQGWTSDSIYHRVIADIDHDGLNDIVGFGAAGVLAGINQGHVLV